MAIEEATEATPEVNRNAQLIAKFVAQAKAEEGANESAVPKEQPRASDGKFAKPEGEAPKPTPDATPAELAEARRLLSEATSGDAIDVEKIDKACKLAFGKSFDELPISAKHWHSLRAEHKKHKAAYAKEQAEIGTSIKRAVDTYEPYANARNALEAGDFEGFLKPYGLTINEFNKRLLSKHFGQVSQDPEVTRLQKRLDEYEAREAKRAAEVRSQAEAEASTKARTEYRESLTQAITGDDRFSKVASKQAFLDRVISIQQQHHNLADNTTIPPLDAAEIAFDELYGGVIEGSERGGNRDSSVRSTPKTVKRSVNTQRTTEVGTPKPKLRGRELMNAFVRQAQADNARENAGK